MTNSKKYLFLSASAAAFAFLVMICAILFMGLKVRAESFSADYGKVIYNADYKSLTGYVYTAYPENLTLTVEYTSKSPDNFREPADVLYVGDIAGQKIYRAGFTQTLTEAPINVKVNDLGTENTFSVRADGAYTIFESERSLSIDTMTDPEENGENGSGSGNGSGNGNGNNGNHNGNSNGNGNNNGNNGNHYGNDKAAKAEAKAEKANAVTKQFKAKTAKVKATAKNKENASVTTNAADAESGSDADTTGADTTITSDTTTDENLSASLTENTSEAVEKSTGDSALTQLADGEEAILSDGTNHRNGLNKGVVAIVIIFALAAVAGGIFTIKKIGR